MAVDWETGNSEVHAEAWVEELQRELDEPNKYEDIADVVFTRDSTINNPYGTDPTVQSITRGCAYDANQINQTNESVTVNDVALLAEIIDRADLAQSRFLDLMERARRQAILLKEDIESSLYADHAAREDFGSEDLTTLESGGTSQITVSASNIDDIIRQVYATILAKGGAAMMERNGGFFVWRPADFSILLGFMQANGFNVADNALSGNQGNPSLGGVNYMGFTHYTSNLLTANHVVAGVKKAYKLYILPDTFGQIMVDEKDPGRVSGVSVVSRVDFREKLWNKVSTIVYDVNVA